MNYSQIVPHVPLCLEKWGVMTPSSYGSAAPAHVTSFTTSLIKIDISCQKRNNLSKRWLTTDRWQLNQQRHQLGWPLYSRAKQAVWPLGSIGWHGMPPSTLTFDRLTLKLVCKSHLRWGTFLPNLGIGLWFLNYSLCPRWTGRPTDRQKQRLILPPSLLVGGIKRRHIPKWRALTNKY